MDECCICQCSLNGGANDGPDKQIGTTVPCGHVFHVECYSRWEHSQRRGNGRTVKCPTCNHSNVQFCRIFLDLKNLNAYEEEDSDGSISSIEDDLDDDNLQLPVAMSEGTTVTGNPGISDDDDDNGSIATATNIEDSLVTDESVDRIQGVQRTQPTLTNSQENIIDLSSFDGDEECEHEDVQVLECQPLFQKETKNGESMQRKQSEVDGAEDTAKNVLKYRQKCKRLKAQAKRLKTRLTEVLASHQENLQKQQLLIKERESWKTEYEKKSRTLNSLQQEFREVHLKRVQAQRSLEAAERKSKELQKMADEVNKDLKTIKLRSSVELEKRCKENRTRVSKLVESNRNLVEENEELSKKLHQLKKNGVKIDTLEVLDDGPNPKDILRELAEADLHAFHSERALRNVSKDKSKRQVEGRNRKQEILSSGSAHAGRMMQQGRKQQKTSREVYSATLSLLENPRSMRQTKKVGYRNQKRKLPF